MINEEKINFEADKESNPNEKKSNYETNCMEMNLVESNIYMTAQEQLEAPSQEQEQEILLGQNNYSNNLNKEKSMLPKLVTVSLASSVLGGLVVGLFIQFGIPSINSKIGNNKAIFSQLSNTEENSILPLGAVKQVNLGTSESTIVKIAEKSGPSVVGIKVLASAQNIFPFAGNQSTEPEGSGIIIKKDGYIMTNNHVIADAMSGNTNKLSKGSKIEIILPSKKDTPYSAIVIGRDVKTDLAVLKIEATDLPEIEMGNSDKVKIGELAIAIGNPGGIEYMGSVTAGIISGLNRTIPIDEGKELKLIQTDASINPGNSGGALLNSKGQLIGVNTAKIGGQGFEGLGFAIPVNQAKEITNSLIQFNYVKGRPLFGIQADPSFNEDVASQYNVPNGVLVADVTPFSGAYKAGIRKGDLITKFAGEQIKSVDELNVIKNKYKPGDSIDVEIYNDDKTRTVKVTLTEQKN